MPNASESYRALLGGALIGVAASGLLLFNGRIAGVSNIFGGLLPPRREDALWRFAFVLGLLVAGALLSATGAGAFSAVDRLPVAESALAGLLVGLGAKTSNGCTSGHGVCGLARFSKRGLAATTTFMLTGAIAVYVARHLLAGYAR